MNVESAPIGSSPDNGTLLLNATAPDVNWARDNRTYRLPTIKTPNLEVELIKHGDGGLEIHVIGIQGRWLIVRGRVPQEWGIKISMRIVWTKTLICVYVNELEFGRLDAAAPEVNNDPVPQLMSLLGDGWCGEYVREDSRSRRRVHPFASFYDAYQKADLERRNRLWGYPYFAALARVIVVASELSGFERVVPDLRRTEVFRDTISELIFAAHLSRSGLRVAFVDHREYGRDGQKSADLVLQTADGISLQAECKHLHSSNDLLTQAGVRWPSCADIVLNALAGQKFVSSVHVLFEALPEEPDMKMIAKQVASLNAPVGSTWFLHASGARFQTWMMRRNVDDVTRSIQATLPPVSDRHRAFVRMEMEGSTCGFRGVRTAGFEMNVPRVDMKLFARRFKKAVGQIWDNGPGVVGLEIHPPRSREEADGYREWLIDEFRKGYFRRVNRVWLFWVSEIVDRRIVAGKEFVNAETFFQFECVDHPDPRSPVEFAR